MSRKWDHIWGEEGGGSYLGEGGGRIISGGGGGGGEYQPLTLHIFFSAPRHTKINVNESRQLLHFVIYY